jgi:mRNA interferase RelE/StbE
MFKIVYHEDVIKVDLPKINPANKLRIKKTIEAKLTARPEVYGKPLRKSLKSYRSLRIGEYRVVFKIKNSFIKVFLIAHRSVVYQKALNRPD